MIKELSDAFRRLVNSLAVRPIATLIAIFLVVTSYIGFKSYNTLEQLVVTPDEEASRFKNQLESSKLVNDSLEHLRSEMGAHSVVIRQFHNGRHDLTGIPFTESTATYYTDNYEGVDDEPLSAMNGSLRRMWSDIRDPRCVVLSAPVDTSSRKYFKNYGLTRVIECPLTNLLNYPIGTVAIGFSGGTVNDKVAIDKTSTIAKRITGYLDNGY